MNTFIKTLILILLFTLPVLAQQKVIRWDATLPNVYTRNYMEDGHLMTSYQDDNVGYVVGLYFDVDDKYIAALFEFGNHSGSPITIYPEKFTFTTYGKETKVLEAIPIEDVVKDIDKRGNGTRFFRSLFAGMAQNTSSTNGTVKITDPAGNTANGTYSSTTTSPDRAAQRRAVERNREEVDANGRRSAVISKYAFRSNTLLKGDMKGGYVFFKRDKEISPGALLSFTIEGVTYEVPYGNLRKK